MSNAVKVYFRREEMKMPRGKFESDGRSRSREERERIRDANKRVPREEVEYGDERPLPSKKSEAN